MITPINDYPHHYHANLLKIFLVQCVNDSKVLALDEALLPYAEKLFEAKETVFFEAEKHLRLDTGTDFPFKNRLKFSAEHVD